MSNNQTTLAKWFHKNGYEPIASLDFYRAIFPSGELATYTDKPGALENNTEWKSGRIKICLLLCLCRVPGSAFAASTADTRYTLTPGFQSSSLELKCIQTAGEWDVILFSKNVYAFEYILIFCKTPG